MATYSITEDPNFPWVSEITITTDYDIDITSDNFNITVKDEFEYFLMKYLQTGDTFELEELFKQDTLPTLEISNNSTQYEKMKCYRCGGTGAMTCPECGGTGYTDIDEICSACSGSDFGVGKITCIDCEGDGLAHTVCDEEVIWTEILSSNLNVYNNSDYDTLVKNGIQFWVDGVGKRTMYIRLVTKGKSSVNPDGYIIFNPVLNDYEKTKYVGFTIADFNITLNKQEKLLFKCYMIPRLVTGNPEKITSGYEPHIVPSGYDRPDFEWNDNMGIDKLYLNNTNPLKTSAYSYDQYTTDPNDIFWESSATSAKVYLTPTYIVKTSAYVNDYLTTGTTTDLLDGTSGTRDFVFTSAMMKSTLYNEFTYDEFNLSADFGETVIEPTVYIESNGKYISGDLYCTEITQYLVDTTSAGKLRKNQVRLKMEI